MVPKIMLEGGHAWVHERPIAATTGPAVDLVAVSVSAVCSLQALQFSCCCFRAAGSGIRIHM
eukprot:SAG25_NODE_12997_length_272_cov_1.780347_1_plen_61_part_10